MNLEQALARFQNTVTRITGDYTRLTPAGFWRRTMKPGDEAISFPSSREAVIVCSGDIEVCRDNGLPRRYSEGETAFLAKDTGYRIVAGESGAIIEYKYF